MKSTPVSIRAALATSIFVALLGVACAKKTSTGNTAAAQTKCQALGKCCEKATGQDKTNCTTAVNGKQETMCSAFQAVYCTSGDGGAPPPPEEGGEGDPEGEESGEGEGG